MWYRGAHLKDEAENSRNLDILLQFPKGVSQLIYMDVHDYITQNNQYTRHTIVIHLEKLGYTCMTSKDIELNSASFIIVEYDNEYIVIDMSFREKFRIARMSIIYQIPFNKLPDIFIGPICILKEIVHIMSQEMKRSFKQHNMHTGMRIEKKYCKRSSGITCDGKQCDITSPKFWSRMVLWNC